MNTSLFENYMHKTKIIGILNVTPDSFSDGGKFLDIANAVSQAKKMIEEGADSIDIGGESTRPGAEQVPAQEELQRILPVLTAIRKQNLSIPISIDTYKSDVAVKCLENGATMINSLGGFLFDEKLARIFPDLVFQIWQQSYQDFHLL